MVVKTEIDTRIDKKEWESLNGEGEPAGTGALLLQTLKRSSTVS